jgi:hypothetical protein
MTFSDEELRVLRAMCENGKFPIAGKGLLPLLHRLECAEKMCQEWESIANTSHPCSMNTFYEAWRKSAGKPEAGDK